MISQLAFTIGFLLSWFYNSDAWSVVHTQKASERRYITLSSAQRKEHRPHHHHQQQQQQVNQQHDERRHFLRKVSSVIMGYSFTFLPSLVGKAQDDVVTAPKQQQKEGKDLTSQLFNEDGSLKEGVESEAKFRKIEFVWDSSDRLENYYLINYDGTNVVSNNQNEISIVNAPLKISYSLPLKWKGPTGSVPSDDLYEDLTVEIDSKNKNNNSIKALNKIIVYQAPGVVSKQELEKATTIGIAQALQVIPELNELGKADLVGGRTRMVSLPPPSSSTTTTTVDNNKIQKYYDFDMAVAPITCGESKENLGLGFCPFETIYLLSGTIVNDKLYVFALICNKDQWKRSNADLRKVRSTFSVNLV